MKAHELRQLSDDELKKRIQDEEENLAHLNFQKALSQVENPMKFRHARRDIARMKTILRARQLSGEIKGTEPTKNEAQAKVQE